MQNTEYFPNVNKRGRYQNKWRLTHEKIPIEQN